MWHNGNGVVPMSRSFQPLLHSHLPPPPLEATQLAGFAEPLGHLSLCSHLLTTPPCCRKGLCNGCHRCGCFTLNHRDPNQASYSAQASGFLCMLTFGWPHELFAFEWSIGRTGGINVLKVQFRSSLGKAQCTRVSNLTATADASKHRYSPTFGLDLGSLSQVWTQFRLGFLSESAAYNSYKILRLLLKYCLFLQPVVPNSTSCSIP